MATESVNHAEAHDSPLHEQSGNVNRAESPATGSKSSNVDLSPKKPAPRVNYGDEMSKGSDSLPMTEAYSGPSSIPTVWMNQDWASMKDVPKREGSKSLPIQWPKQ